MIYTDKIEMYISIINRMSFNGYILASVSTIDDKQIIVPIPPSRDIYYLNNKGNITLDQVLDDMPFPSNIVSWIKILFEMYTYKPRFNLYNDEERIQVSCGFKEQTIDIDSYRQSYIQISDYISRCRQPIIDVSLELSIAFQSQQENKSYSANRIFIDGDFEESSDKYFKSNVYIGEIYHRDDLTKYSGKYKIGRTDNDFEIRYPKKHRTNGSYRRLSDKCDETYIKLCKIVSYPAPINVEKILLELTKYQNIEDDCSKHKELRTGKFNVDLERIIYNSYYSFMVFTYTYDNTRNSTEELFTVSSNNNERSFVTKLMNVIINVVISSIDKTTQYNSSVIFNLLYDNCNDYMQKKKREEGQTYNVAINNNHAKLLFSGTFNSTISGGVVSSHAYANAQVNNYNPISTINMRDKKEDTDKQISDLLFMTMNYMIEKGKFSKSISTNTIMMLTEQLHNTKIGLINNLNNVNEYLINKFRGFYYKVY
jgi:hypothetical protein